MRPTHVADRTTKGLTIRSCTPYTWRVSTPAEMPPGERVGFHVAEDGGVTVELDDGVVLFVKPVVLDVVREHGKSGGTVTYYVQGAMLVTVKKTPEVPG